MGIFCCFVFSSAVFAENQTTTRISQLTNDKVNVWETFIYPSENQQLKMHRHEYDRVVIALDSGTLKVTNDKGKVHYMTFEKGKSYFLTKDVPNELHTDENMSHHLLRVYVIELKG
jgi:hypothetical protein